MNKFDFANNIIAAPWLSRLFDRTFFVPVLFAIIVWATAVNGGTTYDNAIDFTKWVLGPFILAEKGKDAAVAVGALLSQRPATTPVGDNGDADVLPADASEYPNAS